MIRNYLKTALRNILRNKTFTAINVFGLALSLAVCMIIIMIVRDQMKMDRHNVNADRIYRINTQRLHADDPVNTFATTALPIGDELLNNYSGIEKKVSIRRGFGNGWVGIDDDLSIPLSGFFVDPDFFELFDYKLTSGDAVTALTEPFSVVLTQQAATKLYGDNDPMGKLVDMGTLACIRSPV